MSFLEVVTRAKANFQDLGNWSLHLSTLGSRSKHDFVVLHLSISGLLIQSGFQQIGTGRGVPPTVVLLGPVAWISTP